MKTPSYAFIILAQLMLLSSCSNKTAYSQKDPKSVKKELESAGIVKVLNMVRCTKDKQYCPDEEINRIWESCLEDGYALEAPTSQVVSAREITELTQGTSKRLTEETVLTDKEDANGIVSTESSVVYREKQIETKGYCIGSEYITIAE